jgi:hypothetical protein
MAKLKSGAVTNPARACATESKKHVAGQHGTPYSQCVSAAAKVEGSGGDAGAGTTGRDAGGAGSTDARGTTTAS